MKNYTFKVIIEPDGDKWHAYCPILEEKGASTYGDTWDEALKNIKEVLIMTLESMKQHEEKIPFERKMLKNLVPYSEIPVQLSGRY